jgi:hypothetical protein
MSQGTEKILGGTAYKRYPDPASPGTANAQGLYPWSAFTATVCNFTTPDTITPTIDLNNVSYVDLLLFTSDIPAILELRATDTNTNLQFSAGAANTLGVDFLTTAPGGGTLATIPIQGKVLSGYTADTGIFCTGFPAQGNVVPPGTEGAATYTEVFCIANSPVIASPVSALSLAYKQSTSSGFSPVPIIIAYDEYTAAIRDAGNIISLTSDGSLYQVVGLWRN